MDTLHTDRELAQAYAGALHALALADRELQAVESVRLDALLTARTGGGIDVEDLFFTKVTPEGFAAEVSQRAPAQRVAIGQALVIDGVELSVADGDLNGVEARAILRFARALGLTMLEVTDVTRQLDEWLSDLG